MNIYVLKNLWRYTYSRLPYIPSQNTWKRVQIKVSDLKFKEDLTDLSPHDRYPIGTVIHQIVDRLQPWGLFVLVGYRDNLEPDQMDPEYGYVIYPRIRKNPDREGELELGEMPRPYKMENIWINCECPLGGYLDSFQCDFPLRDYLDSFHCDCGEQEKLDASMRNTFVKSQDGIYPVYSAPIMSGDDDIYRDPTPRAGDILAHLDVNPPEMFMIYK